jgi:hypothetical protein
VIFSPPVPFPLLSLHVTFPLLFLKFWYKKNSRNTSSLEQDTFLFCSAEHLRCDLVHSRFSKNMCCVSKGFGPLTQTLSAQKGQRQKDKASWVCVCTDFLPWAHGCSPRPQGLYFSCHPHPHPPRPAPSSHTYVFFPPAVQGPQKPKEGDVPTFPFPFNEEQLRSRE